MDAEQPTAIQKANIFEMTEQDLENFAVMNFSRVDSPNDLKM